MTGEGHGLAELLGEADTATPATRIAYRRSISAHGVAAIEPLLDWVAAKRHTAFAVAVLEAIGNAYPEEARRALVRAGALDATISGLTRDALQRLGRRTEFVPSSFAIDGTQRRPLRVP